jgi:hypothetical protein
VGVSGIRISGGRELRRALRKAEGDLDDLKDAHLKVAQIVAEAAKAAAPVKTGKLAASIRPNAGQRYARVSVGNNRSTKTGIAYAGPIHWGWPTGSPKLPEKLRQIRGREWFIAPNPFVVDVAQRTEPVWTQTYLDALDDIVDKIGQTSDGIGP